MAEKGGKHGAGYMDCTGCPKRQDTDIDDPILFWKLILLYAAIYLPQEYKEYTWTDAYRENRDHILAAVNKRNREARRSA